MFSFIIIAAVYWFFCAAWFSLVQKPIFGIYNRRESQTPLTDSDVAAVYSHGFVSDAIIASYLTAIPLVVGAVAMMIPAVPLHAILTGYNVIIAIAIGLLAVADTLLYPFWKYKIDASVFAYLRSFKGATASVSNLYLAVAVVVWMLVAATFFFGAQLSIEAVMPRLAMPLQWIPWWGYPVVLLALVVAVAMLFAVIRGLGIRPNSPSRVYFSGNQFLNHWALNPGYNMIYSLSVKDEFKDRFVVMPQEECDTAIAEMFPVDGTPSEQLLNTPRPNILLIVWESFGAEFSEAFGGRRGVVPNIDRLAGEGIRFTDCTAGSFRTDRGLVNILSGYPAQPTTSIIRHTRKLPSLPGLPRTLKAEGYRTVAVHGGDLSIMHKSDYYLASGHDRLISQKDFTSKAEAGKWGVHDGPVMERVAGEIERLTDDNKPFFITLQTLSSHEPFDVPYSRLTDPADNSFAYTDHCIGQLIDRLKQSDAWKSMLVVIVADHGFNASMLPDNRRSYAHIPLLMLGGAVRRPAIVDTMMSQTDIAATLLSQMGLDHSGFPFSRDILADTYRDRFALHIFNNGIMISDTEGYTVYDTMLERTIEGDDSPERIARAKTILQKIYNDLDKR